MEVTTQVHKFDVSLKWDYETDSGIARAGSRMPLLFGPPPEFGGTELTWSPEHLLAASVASCYITTFMSFAKRMKVIVTDFRISCKTEFEKKENGFEATRYLLRPLVEIHGNPGQQALDNLFEKAKKYCFISNSVKGEIVIEPNILNG
jgi:organic hydroperoxide reductase OsmC/OhrA